MTKNDIISNDLNLALAVSQNNLQAVIENLMAENVVVSEPEEAAHLISQYIDEGLIEKAFRIMNVPFIPSNDEIMAIYNEMLAELQAANVEIANNTLSHVSELYRFHFSGESTTATPETNNQVPLPQNSVASQPKKKDLITVLFRLAIIALVLYVLYKIFIQ